MADSIPEAPVKGIVSATWTLVYQQATRTSLSSHIGGVMVLGPSYWTLDISVNLPDWSDFHDWQAFIARLEGQAQTFLINRTFGQRQAVTNNLRTIP